MSAKRDFIARIFPTGVPLTESVNNNAKFVAMRRTRFSACPEFADRDGLYRNISEHIGTGPITFLEFGVWKGDSIRRWSALNTNPKSRFVGFDTFEGLPEDWENHSAGTFSTQGILPTIEDPRVSFVKGLFQKTLLGFLSQTSLDDTRLVVNVDCDIYSATIYVLGTLDKYFSRGTVLIFDDFYSMNDEFKAFADYDRSFGRTWRALGRMPYCVKTAIEIES